jgi:hypothetical protein
MPKNRHVNRAMNAMFGQRPPNSQVLPDPMHQQSPWFWTAGPVFYPGADGAILNSKLSKPWQVREGYAYRVANPQRYSALQPSQLYAPKGVPTVGINIQLGNEGVLTPAVNDDGTFPDQGVFGYDPATQTLTASSFEGEW